MARVAMRAIFLILALMLPGDAVAEAADEGVDQVQEGMSEDEAATILEDLDLNKDGKVDKEELLKTDEDDAGEGGFAEMLEKHFPAADADGDGALDSKELATLIDLFSKDEEL
mmetsp:Transcript_69190/g.200763  ORF Transcript_69190/g.200763 Transcript_69190/m.200763 type:complete len:113 (+) Transcript_69190:101-439(+)